MSGWLWVKLILLAKNLSKLGMKLVQLDYNPESSHRVYVKTKKAFIIPKIKQQIHQIDKSHID